MLGVQGSGLRPSGGREPEALPLRYSTPTSMMSFSAARARGWLEGCAQLAQAECEGGQLSGLLLCPYEPRCRMSKVHQTRLCWASPHKAQAAPTNAGPGVRQLCPPVHATRPKRDDLHDLGSPSTLPSPPHPPNG
jgi:hypothetical protein